MMQSSRSDLKQSDLTSQQPSPFQPSHSTSTQHLGSNPQGPSFLSSVLDPLFPHGIVPLSLNHLGVIPPNHVMYVFPSMVHCKMCFPHNGKIVTIDQLKYYEPKSETSPESIILFCGE